MASFDCACKRNYRIDMSIVHPFANGCQWLGVVASAVYAHVVI